MKLKLVTRRGFDLISTLNLLICLKVCVALLLFPKEWGFILEFLAILWAVTATVLLSLDWIFRRSGFKGIPCSFTVTD
jgi:hypothetical protein